MVSVVVTDSDMDSCCCNDCMYKIHGTNVSLNQSSEWFPQQHRMSRRSAAMKITHSMQSPCSMQLYNYCTNTNYLKNSTIP